MNKNLLIALAAFVVLLVAALVMRSKPDRVGVKEFTYVAPAADQITKFEVALAAKNVKPAPDAGTAATKEPGTRFVLENIDGAWRVYDPNKPDKKFVVEAALANAAVASVGEFKTGDLIGDSAGALVEYAIDDESAQRIKVYTGSTVAVDLLFGRNAAGGPTVRAVGSNDVHIAKGRLPSALKKEISAWRRKTIIELKPEDIVSVKTQRPDSPAFTVVGTEVPAPPPAEPVDGGTPPEPQPAKKDWKITEPSTLPAGFRVDPLQIGRIATLISSVRASEFAEDVTDEAAGFNAPHTTVEVSLRDQRKFVMHLGKVDDKKRAHLRVDGDPQVYLVAEYTANQLGRKLDDLRDLSLITATPGDITRVSFKGSQSTIVVQKDGEVWKLVEPKTPPPDFSDTQIEAQVAAAARLRGSRYLGPPTATSGLAKASPIIEFVAKDKKVHTIRFGASTETKGAAPGAEAIVEWVTLGSADSATVAVTDYARKRYDNPATMFKKPPSQPHLGTPEAMGNLDNLPPDVRRQIEASLKKGGGSPH